MNNPQKHTFFQFALLGFFAFCALAGVIILAIFRSEDDSVVIKVPITIWGPSFKDSAFTTVLKTLEKEDKSFELVTYVRKNPARIYGDLVEAIATGNAPDLVIIEASELLSMRNKLLPISFETIPKSLYTDTYVEGAEIFMLHDAIYALPLFVDPLVLYWNRDLYANAAIAQVPKDWDTLIPLVPRLSVVAGEGDLIQGAIAFGEYDNVLHAKEILSAMLMQTGVSLVVQKEDDFKTDLNDVQGAKNPQLALSAYTAFSNPSLKVYSWNKTFDRSREAFAANKVAMYGGFVSEETVLTEINPNLNFGMSVWPQANNEYPDITYGKFYGIAVLRSSEYAAPAFYIAQQLVKKEASEQLSELTGLSSTRRDLLTYYDETDPFGKTKTQSAIISHSWLEPSPKSAVDDSFRSAVHGIVSGTKDPGQAVKGMSGDLSALLKQYNKK